MGSIVEMLSQKMKAFLMFIAENLMYRSQFYSGIVVDYIKIKVNVFCLTFNECERGDNSTY